MSASYPSSPRRILVQTLCMGLVTAASLSTGCLLEESSVGQSEAAARGGRPPKASTTECSTEASDPLATGAIKMSTDATGGPVVIVEAMNTGYLPRLIGARLRTQVGGLPRAAERVPQLVRPGAIVNHEFGFAELGIDPATATIPSRLSASLIVREEDGTFAERVALKGVNVGPEVGVALDNLLRRTKLRVRDLETTGIPGLTAKVVSIDKGDGGLMIDQLNDPDDDGGIPNIPPNYDSAVPDKNGNYHYNFCLRWPIDLVDAGFGEDYGIDPEGSWKARGGKVRINSHDTNLFDGYLDFNGCTGEIVSPYHTDFFLVGYGIAQMGGNTVIAKDGNGNTQGWLRLVDYVGGSGTKYYNFAPGSLTNLVAVPTFTLARFGGVTGETFTVNEACYPDGDQCCNCAAGGEIWISSTQRKFLIAHEMGHRILSMRAGSYNNDVTLGVSDVHPCYSDSGHAIDSLEYQSGAAMEGWAHFVAVRAFNNHLEGDNPGAVLQYWRGSGFTVDVEQGPTGGVTKYFESMCGGTQVNMATGFGVELDWLRAWWDYHTNPSPGSPTSQSQIMDEIAEGSGWNRTNIYQSLVDGIEALSGTDQRDRWTAIAAGNGIDH